MNCRIAILAASLAVASAAPAMAMAPAVATLSSSKAGARHVTLTISITAELQCGRLMGSRTLAVTLPARIATSVPASAVTVGGKAVRAVSVAGRAVTVTLAPPRGIMCDSIRTGVAKLVFLPAANVVNPASPGSYAVRVAHGSQSYSAPLAIHA
jgi:hypothetical protein